jgi:hypothetical protein
MATTRGAPTGARGGQTMTTEDLIGGIILAVGGYVCTVLMFSL